MGQTVMDIRIKTILASAVPILALLTGLYFALQSLSVAMGSTVYMPDMLRELPAVIWTLVWWTLSVGITVAIVRVAFAFSRFTEMRGRHEYPIQNVDVPRSDTLLSVPRGVSLDHTKSEHERARQLAGRASRRASRQSNIGNISVPTASGTSDANRSGAHEPLPTESWRGQLL